MFKALFAAVSAKCELRCVSCSFDEVGGFCRALGFRSGALVLEKADTTCGACLVGSQKNEPHTLLYTLTHKRQNTALSRPPISAPIRLTIYI